MSECQELFNLVFFVSWRCFRDLHGYLYSHSRLVRYTITLFGPQKVSSLHQDSVSEDAPEELCTVNTPFAPTLSIGLPNLSLFLRDLLCKVARAETGLLLCLRLLSKAMLLARMPKYFMCGSPTDLKRHYHMTRSFRMLCPVHVVVLCNNGSSSLCIFCRKC